MKKNKSHQYNKRVFFLVILAITYVVIWILVRNFELTRRIYSVIGIIFIFYLADKLLNLDYKKKHYLYVIIIMVGGTLLIPVYFYFSQFDKIQHIVLPILLASIVFHLISKLKLSMRMTLILTFFVVTGYLAIHEIGEYLIDTFLSFKIQGVHIWSKSGLEKFILIQSRIDDTMIDMMLGVAGTLIYVLSTTLFFKKKN